MFVSEGAFVVGLSHTGVKREILLQRDLRIVLGTVGREWY